MDVKGRRVWMREEQVDLTRLEFNLLAYLMQRLGSIVTADELLDRIWKDEERSMDTLRTGVRRLRHKLGDEAPNPEYVKNVWGVGYQIGD